jgi:hypothetical protein
VYWASETRTAPLNGDLVAKAPAIFPLWWATWLISTGLQNISFRLSSSDHAVSESMWVGVVALPFTFVSALCVIAIIWSIESRQEHLARFGELEWPTDEPEEPEETEETEDAPSAV